jgi:2,5-diamino-6-(ribosylamino)-4(3H)-pyrimidinone 5'-phosphate reductase
MSVDGKIALKTRRQTHISNEEDKRRVHKLRNSSDAILVGVETVIADDPKLTVNPKYVKKPRHPLRIVLDSKGRTPKDAHVLDGSSKTLIVTNEKCKKVFPNAAATRCGKQEVELKKLMKILEKKGIRTLLVEGGSKVIWSFLRSRIADEVNIFVGSMVIGGDKSPTPAGGDEAETEKAIVALRLRRMKAIGNGVLLTYEVVK